MFALKIAARYLVAPKSHNVVNVIAESSLINPETHAFDLAAAGMMAYSHGGYYAIGEKLGHFGFSVKKNKRSNHQNPK